MLGFYTLYNHHDQFTLFSHCIAHVFVISGVCYVECVRSFDWSPFRRRSHPRVYRGPTMVWGPGWVRRRFASSVLCPTGDPSHPSEPSPPPEQCQNLKYNNLSDFFFRYREIKSNVWRK